MKVWTFEVFHGGQSDPDTTVIGVFDSFEKAHELFSKYITKWDETQINKFIVDFGGDLESGQINTEYLSTYINEWEVK